MSATFGSIFLLVAAAGTWRVGCQLYVSGHKLQRWMANFPAPLNVPQRHTRLFPDAVSVIGLLLAAVAAAPSSPPYRRSAVIIDDWLLIGYRGGGINAPHAGNVHRVLRVRFFSIDLALVRAQKRRPERALLGELACCLWWNKGRPSLLPLTFLVTVYKMR